MIHLITGLPGSGKTVYALDLCLQLARESSRPLVIFGIKNLTVGSITDVSIREISEIAELDTLAGGEIVLIDEVQRVLRPRKLGAAMSDWQQSLETHRHEGIDYIFTTQDYRLLDAHARRLVGKHTHIRALPGSRANLLHSDQVIDPEKEKHKAKSSVVWSYPAEIFSLYESTKEITKAHAKRSLGGKFWARMVMVAIPIILLVFMIFKLIGVLNSGHFGTAGEDAEHSPADDMTFLSLVQSSGLSASRLSADDPHLTYVPRMRQAPWSAPAYDDFFESAQDWPRPHCIIIHTETGNDVADCICKTQQLTPLPGIPPSTCVTFARHGMWDPTINITDSMRTTADPAERKINSS